MIPEGQGDIEVGELQAQTIIPDDVVIIPHDTRQRVTNTGVGDLLFLAICTAGFEINNYIAVN